MTQSYGQELKANEGKSIKGGMSAKVEIAAEAKRKCNSSSN